MRVFLLAFVGIPVVLASLASTVFGAFTDPKYLAGDFIVYLHAARTLAVGGDPYGSFVHSTVLDPTLNQGYIYPPLLAWFLQPLTFLGDRAATAVAAIVVQLLLAGFVLLLRPVLELRSWEATGWLYVAAAGWYPARANLQGAEVNILMLFLVTAFLLAAASRASGVPLGATVAIKFLTAPLLGYLLLRRRWWTAVGAVLAIAALWAVSSPRWLPEYFSQVLPEVAQATGFRENVSPTGFFIRLLMPESLYGQTVPAPFAANLLGLVTALGVLALTAWRLGVRMPANRRALVLEVSAVLAVCPLVATLAWPSHLVLLLLPLSTVAVEGFRAGDRALLGLVAGGWLLLGPVHTTVLTGIAAGVVSGPALRGLTELGVLGVLLVFAASLRALDFRTSE